MKCLVQKFVAQVGRRSYISRRFLTHMEEAEIKDMNTAQKKEQRSGKPVLDPLVKRA